ncbi:MAG: hypothetical protein R3E96_14905 [Planctomycetota bacterium]
MDQRLTHVGPEIARQGVLLQKRLQELEQRQADLQQRLLQERSTREQLAQTVQALKESQVPRKDLAQFLRHLAAQLHPEGQ